MAKAQEPLIHHYFVDEAGDLTFFNKHGQIVVGNPGASKCFMVGVARLPDPVMVERVLAGLRTNLLADPRFQNIPSMQPSARKTALFFHAKDDYCDVRNEVFKLLPKIGAKVTVAIRRKMEIAQYSQQLYNKFGTKMNVNDIYDDLLKRLFKNLLHKASENHIVFARRGKGTREAALRDAIARAQKNFELQWGISSNSLIKITPAYPHEFGGLQVVDYYLWALQRLYERNQDQFFNPLARDYRLIMDLDDKRNKVYGEWYKDSNPLSLGVIKL